ncbi:patatin-like phospholipase family protein [Runella sp. MFBS21]|uniref:patatin-like phospholipase family protein n=1 Tax=Runella sp. MFBS21 TaxID=3034018 RepID=UPI0023F9AE65|nr:patatin-like phospholipase family protein [Runella sp. MFBS21]MDF7821915.1 patatin-like phospholipase family protein [Runella sp. MFBS21]
MIQKVFLYLSKYCLIYSLFLYSFSVFSQKKYHNLVLEGGGIRGIAYCGAIQELEQRGLLKDIRRLGGTSAGAIQASLLAVGYSAAELTDLVATMKIQSFNDGQYIFVGGTQRLIERFGWYRGDAFKKWIGEKIERKTGNASLTFGQLHNLTQQDSCFKDLYVTVTNLTQQKAMVLSHEHFSDLTIADAVRASMSIPLYYCAVFMDSTGKFYERPPRNIAADVLVDGGLLMNYPIGLFDQNRFLSAPNPYISPESPVFNAETIGLRLESAEQIKADAQNFGLAPYPIRSFKTYMGAFYNLVSEAANRYNFRPEDLQRTISIDFKNVGAKVRKLSEIEKKTLIDSGKECVGDFCQPISSLQH